jgi:hypothetical protein
VSLRLILVTFVLTVVLAMAAVPGLASAASTISGTVKEAVTGTPIAGTEVHGVDTQTAQVQEGL